MLQLGQVLGAFSAIFLIDRLGPRLLLMVTCVFMLGPIAIQVFSNTHAMLLAGKLLAGSSLLAL